MAIKITRRISAETSTSIRNICTTAAVETNMVAKPVHQPNKEATSPVEIDGNERRHLRLLPTMLASGKTVHDVESVYLKRKCGEPRSIGKSHQETPQIMEGMELSNANFSHEDLGLRLDLISRAQGVAAAETYFGGLSPPEKNQYTYGALLNCYCEKKLADKALALFEEMDNMSFASSTALNNLMTLYMRLDQPEKVPPLVQDMKNRNIPLSSFSFKIWMQSLSQSNDIDGVEQVFEELTRDNKVNRDWTTYSILPVVYLRAGLHEKAEAALKKLEKEMQPLQREAFHFLITMYAAISNLGEVHRIWNVLKSSFETLINCSYDIMLLSLARLNDIDGLKKCFEEWESSCSHYDVRLVNNLMTLYMRLDEPEKVPPLVQDMKNRNIPLSSFNFKIWMQSLSQLNDIDGVEQVFEEMMRDNNVNHDWTSYRILPVVYVRAGLHEKAEAALKKLEKEMQPLPRDAFHFLINMYAATSNHGEVHRIWNVLKSSSETIINCSYDIMLQSLARLKDIDGLKKCFEEWESSCSHYDMRLVNTAVDAYLSSEKEKEAGLVLRRARIRSSGPLYISYLTFATFYLKNWMVDRAMGCIDAAMSEAEKCRSGQNSSLPSPESVDYIMKYFEAERNVNGAEKLCKLFKMINCLDNKTYDLLLRTYVAADKTEPQMRKRMEDDSIPLNSELENLLKKVCPE